MKYLENCTDCIYKRLSINKIAVYAVVQRQKYGKEIKKIS